MRKANFITIGALTLAACASSQKPPEAAQTRQAPPATGAQTMDRGAMHEECPMFVEGTTVKAEEADGGAALAFTTTGDVGELRRRVARMAEMHNARQTRRQMMMGQSGPTTGSRGQASDGPDQAAPRGMMMRMVPATARAEETSGGARIVFTPQDPGDVGALQQQVTQRVKHMKPGQCPMMMMMMMMGAPPESAVPQDGGEHETHHPEGDATPR